ncbi:unnamed protein product, partial [Pleuronectes platessa]
MGDNTQDGGLSVGLRARPVLVLGLSLEARSETFLGIFSTQDGGLSVGPRARPVLVLGLSMEARDGGLSVGLRARPVLVLGLSMEAWVSEIGLSVEWRTKGARLFNPGPW